MNEIKAVNGAKSFCSHNVLTNVRTKNNGSRLPPCAQSQKTVLVKINKFSEQFTDYILKTTCNIGYH